MTLCYTFRGNCDEIINLGKKKTILMSHDIHNGIRRHLERNCAMDPAECGRYIQTELILPLDTESIGVNWVTPNFLKALAISIFERRGLPSVSLIFSRISSTVGNLSVNGVPPKASLITESFTDAPFGRDPV